MSVYLTCNAPETKKIAKKIAKRALRYKPGQALIFGLKGNLGSGKTTFAQGFAQGLGVKEKILSPTFVIAKKFAIKKKTSFNYFFHFDCYRLDKEKDILNLGFKEIINSNNIVLIEWAERIKNILPQSTIWLDFEFIDENKRKIIMTYDL